MDLAAGMLVVATPGLQDPNFADTVVLLLDVNPDGALGVVLNRPSQVLVGDVLEPWRDMVSDPEVLFQGGPVGTDGAIAVAQLRDENQTPIGWRPVTGRLGMVDLDAPTELVEGSLSALRVFAGYAGWGAGQLQREIAREDWYVLAGQVDDAFSEDVTGLWREVMRRQPGMLAWHVNRPADPDLN